jgi:hypothetical protein
MLAVLLGQYCQLSSPEKAQGVKVLMIKATILREILVNSL